MVESLKKFTVTLSFGEKFRNEKTKTRNFTNLRPLLMLNENNCHCHDRVCVLYIQKSFLQPTWSWTNQRRHSHLIHSDCSLFGGTCHLNDTIILSAKAKWPLLIVFFFAVLPSNIANPKPHPFYQRNSRKSSSK